MRLTPFYLGATDEVTMSLTLHVQASTDRECRFSFYGTLPISIELDPDPLHIGPPIHDPRTVLGTADIGVFGGGRRGSVTTIFRVGARSGFADRRIATRSMGKRLGRYRDQPSEASSRS